MAGPSVVVTGGTRGLGFGLADAFLALGASVTISGRSQAGVDEAVRRLQGRRAGAAVTGVVGNVARADDCEALWAAAAKAYGRVDVWINNAGVGGVPDEFAKTPADGVTPVVEANVLGAMHGTRVALQRMQKQGSGQIYNVEGFGSSGSMRSGMSVYGATKYAVRYFTRSVAKEVAGGAVLICTLVPGLVATDMLQQQYDAASPGRRKFYDLAMDLPETIGAGVAPQMLANRKHGAVVSWIGPGKLLGRLLSSKYKNRKLLTAGAAK